MERDELVRFFLYLRPDLARYAASLCGDGEEVDDLLQETFCRALAAVDQARAGSSAKAWLCSILHNAAVSDWRRRGRLRPVDPAPAGGASRLEVADERYRPDRHADAHLCRERVRRALAGIPRDYRTALLLHDEAELCYADIAEIEDISLGTVRSRISRGRRLLREQVCLVVRSAGYEDCSFVEEAQVGSPTSRGPGGR